MALRIDLDKVAVITALEALIKSNKRLGDSKPIIKELTDAENRKITIAIQGITEIK